MYSQKFDLISNNLLNFGVKMDEEDKSLLLLYSLLFSYDPLVTMLLYENEILFYENIVSVLRFNEQRKKLTKERAPQEGLTIEKRSGRGKDRSKQKGRSKF